MILLIGLNETLKPKRGKILEIFERDGRIGRQNYRTETRVKMTECLGFLNLIEALSVAEGL